MNMINALSCALNMKETENGALAYSSTMNAVLDMFALGAAYRNRSTSDVITLFEKAYCENPTLALKCLFWIRDCRGGAGERRFFRVAMNWLGNKDTEVAARLIPHIAEYGRYDDLYCFVGTFSEVHAMNYIAEQLFKDVDAEFPTLCAKWAPSENASSEKTRAYATLTRNVMGLSSREYRKMLSKIRARLNVLETIMSGKRWEEIDFGKIPSVAGHRYAHCFSTREELKDRYAAFIKSDHKVNANVLFPYECVAKAQRVMYKNKTDIERIACNKYWENLPNYIADGDSSQFMCVCDTSGSMTWGNNSSGPKPIDVAISLAIYFAERAKGPFANHYISFASCPRLVEITGVDFVDKVKRIYNTNLCDNTNLKAVFDLLLSVAKRGVPAEDFVKNLFIISDMEIDQATCEIGYRSPHYHGDAIEDHYDSLKTLMEQIRENWENQTDIPFPKLYYWNVNGRNNTVLSIGSDVSYISGASPAILKQVLSGKTSWDLCLETLLSDRYAPIQ